MPNWRHILLVVLAGLLGFLLVVARAEAFDNAGAVAIAAAHYGEPCGGSVDFQWDHLGDTINAHSTWTSVDGGPPFDCSVTWSLDADWTPAKFCTVTEHEIGHLTGHVHGEDAIMAELYTVPSPECAAAYPPRVLPWRPGPRRVAALDRNPRAAVIFRHHIRRI
jgi:hypothetical protein